MYATIILGLVLAVLATDLGPALVPPHPLVPGVGLVLAVLAVFAGGLAISGYILLRRDRIETDEQRFLRTVGLLGKLYRLVVIGAYAIVVLVFGWAGLAQDWAAGAGWRVPVLAVNLAPLVVLFLVAWTALFWADRRLRVLMLERAGAPVAGRPWTFPRYLEFMLRQYLLVILVPIVVLLGLHDVVAHLLGGPGSEPLAALVDIAVLVGAAALAGPWVRLCWRTEPLPDGLLRSRLMALARRAGVRVADILIWRTNHSIANGCMIGVVGPLRYILITDALLLSLSPEEVEAVFAHEAGHVKYRHVVVFMLMTLGAISAAVLLGEVVALVAGSFWTGAAAMGAGVLAYLVFGFGYISRRCEQECDLYAVRATTCPAGCSPPDAGRTAPGVAEPDGAATAVPAPPDEDGKAGKGPDNPSGPAWPKGESPPAGSICAHRVRTFATALRRIARLNGMAERAGGWRHFSIARRRRFLRYLLDHPKAVRQVERSMRRLKTLAIVAAVAALLGSALMLVVVQALLPEDPEHPAGPEDVPPRKPTWIVRLVDRDEMDGLSLGPPQFHRDADSAGDPDDGRPTGFRLGVAAGDDDIAVANAGGHAVAVDAKGERPRRKRRQARNVDELGDATGRGRA